MSEELRTGEVPIPGIRAVESLLKHAPHREGKEEDDDDDDVRGLVSGVGDLSVEEGLPSAAEPPAAPASDA